MSSRPAHALYPTERETPAIAAEPAPTVEPVQSPVTIGVLAARWFRLNKGRLRATLIGALSLVAFLILWHLLTKYRVVFFVRFTNVPSPLAVYESFTTAIHDPKFLMHVWLSCRRIIFGFSLAALVAVPLGLVMGRFKLIHETVFPVAEVLRPIPRSPGCQWRSCFGQQTNRASSSSLSSARSFRSW
jgi:NitT/TauT family transport system permease protein